MTKVDFMTLHWRKFVTEDINACSNRHCEERSNLALCAFNNYSNILIL